LPEAFYDESCPAFDVGRMRVGRKKTRQNKEIEQEKSFQSRPATPIPSI
jgi:hypothetical protein